MRRLKATVHCQPGEDAAHAQTVYSISADAAAAAACLVQSRTYLHWADAGITQGVSPVVRFARILYRPKLSGGSIRSRVSRFHGDARAPVWRE